MLAYIPDFHAAIYTKIRKKVKGNIIKTSHLKEIISHSQRMPLSLVYNHIKDMEKMKLIKRINHTKYRILNNAIARNAEKRIERKLQFSPW